MHTRDEEDSLFPRLIGIESPEVSEALKGVARLEAEHRTAEAAHAEVDELGRQWLEDDRLLNGKSGTLQSLMELLREAYRTHIAFEDEVLFPLARKVLAEDDIEQIGREMAARRGLDYDNLPDINRCTQRRLQREAAEAA